MADFDINTEILDLTKPGASWRICRSSKDTERVNHVLCPVNDHEIVIIGGTKGLGASMDIKYCRPMIFNT